MSYNIDTWKTKRLESLQLPLAAFFRSEREDWHPRVQIYVDRTVEMHCGCEQEIKGLLIAVQELRPLDSIIEITGFDMTGEGSGTFYREVLLPALRESKGTLEAVLVWEGGDSVTRLNVKDGRVLETAVEL